MPRTGICTQSAPVTASCSLELSFFFQIPAIALAFTRVAITGSSCGSMADCEELIQLCADKGIAPETEVVGAERIDEVFDLVARGSDRVVRYVLDMERTFK